MDTYPQHGAPSTTVDSNGTQRWYLNGQLHREDGPAVILCDGTQRWFWKNRRVDPIKLFLLAGQEA
jgi:hypothetical protein